MTAPIWCMIATTWPLAGLLGTASFLVCFLRDEVKYRHGHRLDRGVIVHPFNGPRRSGRIGLECGATGRQSNGRRE